MTIDDEKLMAYCDGELPAAEAAHIEAELAQDETLRAKLAAHLALRTRLSRAFDGALSEPVPTALLTAAQRPREGEIIDFAQARTRKGPKLEWSMREWAAVAASLAIGAVIGLGVMNAEAPMIVTAENGLAAHGALAHALDDQLASDSAGAVRIGVSFRAQNGGYCRTFALTLSGVTGLACRSDGETWDIAMTAASSGGEVRTAGSSEQIMNAVDGMIAGEPFDAAREKAARDADWR
jgi:hypothetical protein